MNVVPGRALALSWPRSVAERLAFLLRPFFRRLLGYSGRGMLQTLLGGRVVHLRLPCEAGTVEPWAPDRPLLSVVIPCFNAGAYLLQALRSLERQTFRDFEVIVVDDGSDDPRTLKLLARLAGCRGLTRLRRANGGPGAARNSGIGSARGRYICCLDADDYLAPDYLEKCLVMLEGDAGVRLAHSWLQVFGDEQRLARTLDLDPELLRYINHLGVSAVFHRADWVAVGGFSEARECLYEDWDFWIRLASLGVRGRVIEEGLLYYRRHGRSRLHSANRRAWHACRSLRRAHVAFYVDAEWRRSLARGYSRRLVSQPMNNLARPQQYRHYPEGVALLYLRSVAESARGCWQAIQELPGRVPLQVIVEHEEELPVWLHQRADRIYRLPTLLDSSQWSAFVENFQKTRRVVRILGANAGSL